VAIGIGVGDVLIRAIGTGALQIALIVGLALTAARVFGSGSALSTEAAVSAALVATVAPETQGFPPLRFLDALVGGATALVFSQLLFPVHPVRVVREAVRSILGDLAVTLDDMADALERRDLDAARRTLVRARTISAEWSDVERALDAGREAVRFAPPRRRLRSRFADHQDVGLPLDLTVRDARILARGTVRALTIDDPIPSGVPVAIRELALGARALQREFAEGGDHTEVRNAALQATWRATEALPSDENISASVLVGHVQATSADMLRSLGIERDEAHGLVGEAAVAAGRD
jgi:hypothetical protein